MLQVEKRAKNETQVIISTIKNLAWNGLDQILNL
ncbi:hypothetical protein MNBD_GAMMA12-719 [hydrothermal vent metagenome]|uniref:Uncharacterized protein n=1 Tax=hydrothermal vent metagenome TaxID=652676 RepID=A0A3B0YL76_9ZZZZ